MFFASILVLPGTLLPSSALPYREPRVIRTGQSLELAHLSDGQPSEWQSGITNHRHRPSHWPFDGSGVTKQPAYISCGTHVLVHYGDVFTSFLNYPTTSITARVQQRVPDVTSVAFDPPDSPSTFGLKPWKQDDTVPFSLGLKHYLRLRKRFCPNEHIALLGFHARSREIHELLNDDDTIDESQVSSIILFGDTLFTPGRPWSRGSATAGTGDLINNYNAVTFNAPWDWRTLSFCDKEDQLCNGTQLYSDSTDGNSRQETGGSDVLSGEIKGITQHGSGTSSAKYALQPMPPVEQTKESYYADSETVVKASQFIAFKFIEAAMNIENHETEAGGNTQFGEASTGVTA